MIPPPSREHRSFPRPPGDMHRNPGKTERSRSSMAVLSLILCHVGIGLLLLSAVVGSIVQYSESPDYSDYDDHEDYEKDTEDYADRGRILGAVSGLLRIVGAVSLGFCLMLFAFIGKGLSKTVKAGMFIAGGLIIGYTFTSGTGFYDILYYIFRQ